MALISDFVPANLSVLIFLVAFGQMIMCLPPLLQLCSGRQLVPLHEDRGEGPVHPDLRGERCREDGGIQEDSAVLRRHLSGQRAGADSEGPPAAVQPCARGESPQHFA